MQAPFLRVVMLICKLAGESCCKNARRHADRYGKSYYFSFTNKINMKNRNLLFTTLIAFVLVLSMKAQSPPSIQWQKCFGGSSDDNAMVSVQQTSDGGYIMTGSTFSNDGDLSGNHGGVDCWVAKLDNAGSIQWKKCLDRKSTRLNSSHSQQSRMPSSA